MSRHWRILPEAVMTGALRSAVLSAALCLLLSVPSFGSDDRNSVLILLSNSFAPYLEAFKGIESVLSEQGGAPVIIQENFAKRSHVSIAKIIRDSQPEIIVTIGTEATLATLDMNMDIPIVFSMVLDPPEELMNHSGVTGVLLDIPAETQVSWIRKVCPNASRIGVIYTRSTLRWVSRVRESAIRQGLEIVPLLMSDISTLPEMLSRLEQSADVLLAVPDGAIYNTVISPQIILFCLKHRIPFIGLSGNFTRAGALFALDCDYMSIGAQTGEMVREILSGSSPSSIPPAHARKVIPSFNMRTARILGIRIPHNLLEDAKIFAD